MPEVNLKATSDTSALKRSYKEVRDSLQQLSYFNEKISKKDPYSKKSLDQSKKALTEWTRVQQQANAALKDNDKILTSIIKHRQALEKALEKADAREMKPLRKQIASLKRVEATRHGWKMLGGDLAEGASLAGNVENAQEPQSKRSAFSASIQTYLIKKAIETVVEGAKQGWQAAKTVRDLSLLGGEGELGGINKKTHTPYGLYTVGSSLATHAQQTYQNAWLGKMGFNPLLDTYSEQETLRGASGFPVENLTASHALAMTKMGYSNGSMAQFATGITGGMGENGGPAFSQSLTDIFSKAVTLGFTGVQRGQFFDSIKNLQEAAQQTAVNTDPKQFIGVMTRLNSMGVTSGNYSLVGARGGEFAQGIQNSLFNPGGGIAGKLATMRMFGFKGNLVDYYKGLGGGVTEDMLKSVWKMAKDSPYMAALMFGKTHSEADIKQMAAFGASPFNFDKSKLKEGQTIEQAVAALMGQTQEGTMVGIAEKSLAALQNIVANTAEIALAVGGAASNGDHSGIPSTNLWRTLTSGILDQSVKQTKVVFKAVYDKYGNSVPSLDLH